MQDNFNLAKYLRNNPLLNEGIGGYVDLKPLNSLNEDESIQFKEGDTVKIKDGQQFGDNPYMGVGEERFEDLKDQELEVTGIDDNGQTIWINDVDSLPASYLELVGEMNELTDFGNMEEAKDKLFSATLDTADFKKIMPYLKKNGIKAKIVKAVGPAAGWPLIKYTASEEKLKDMIKTYWAPEGSGHDAEDEYANIKPVDGNMNELGNTGYDTDTAAQNWYASEEDDEIAQAYLDREAKRNAQANASQNEIEKPEKIYADDSFVQAQRDAAERDYDDDEELVDGFEETRDNAQRAFVDAIESLRMMSFEDDDIIDMFKTAFNAK